MLATILLVGMTCGYDESSKCDVSFEQVYDGQSVAEFKSDAKHCLTTLEKLPDVETVSIDKFKYYGCFTVDYNVKPGRMYLENMLDKDDSFMWAANEIKVK